MTRVYFGLPDPHIFQLPPGPHPFPRSPAWRSKLSWDRPINISPTLFHHTLNVEFPLLIATLYALLVCTFNYFNKKRQNRPWPLSLSPLFYQFVLIHNVGLVLFSAWVVFGAYQTIKSSLMHRGNTLPLASAIECLCRFDRNDGIGYSRSQCDSNCHSFDTLYPGVSQPNTLWDQGIDYYMWMFYMSKFYEVVDTALILMKGRNSSFLQTYHHAGVMLCTWAGVRYASPPAIVGMFLNSMIHTIMVSSCFQVPCPRLC